MICALKPKLCLLYLEMRSILLLLLLLAAPLAQAQNYRSDLMSQFLNTSGGNDMISMSLRDSVLYPLKYLEPELNDLYARFLAPDSFVINKDMRVKVSPDAISSKGIAIVFEMHPKVEDKDKDFKAHVRLGKMFVGHLKNEAKVADAPLFWKVSVDTFAFTNPEVLQTSIFGTRNRIIWQDPAPTDSAAYKAINEAIMPKASIAAIDFALQMFQFQDQGFERVYTPILSFENLEYGQDAWINLERNEFDPNALMVMFHMNSRAVAADPELKFTRDLATGIVKRLKEKAGSSIPEWLGFRAAADTSGGDGIPVLLVGAN